MADAPYPRHRFIKPDPLPDALQGSPIYDTNGVLRGYKILLPYGEAGYEDFLQRPLGPSVTDNRDARDPEELGNALIARRKAMRGGYKFSELADQVEEKEVLPTDPSLSVKPEEAEDAQT